MVSSIRKKRLNRQSKLAAMNTPEYVIRFWVVTQFVGWQAFRRKAGSMLDNRSQGYKITIVVDTDSQYRTESPA
jgi:hypothetical protein